MLIYAGLLWFHINRPDKLRKKQQKNPQSVQYESEFYPQAAGTSKPYHYDQQQDDDYSSYSVPIYQTAKKTKVVPAPEVPHEFIPPQVEPRPSSPSEAKMRPTSKKMVTATSKPISQPAQTLSTEKENVLKKLSLQSSSASEEQTYSPKTSCVVKVNKIESNHASKESKSPVESTRLPAHGSAIVVDKQANCSSSDMLPTVNQISKSSETTIKSSNQSLEQNTSKRRNARDSRRRYGS